jgi:hypothetical protein
MQELWARGGFQPQVESLEARQCVAGPASGQAAPGGVALHEAVRVMPKLQ